MLDTWEQRVRRDGIKLTKVSFPVPPKSMDVLADRLLSAITPATKVLHFCHITNLTGQIFPVKKIADEARRRGIKTIVDGAHAFAHFPFTLADLGCDYYGTSLHKWLLAPIGTGFLYVRKENIASLWPLTPAAASRADNIRKFEEIGTHPAANHNAIAEALTFHEGIGIERKAARLRYLRNRWADRLGKNPKSGSTRISTRRTRARSATSRLSAMPSAKVVAQLWEKWRIIATPIVHEEYTGLRITPNVYTTLEEMDTFREGDGNQWRGSDWSGGQQEPIGDGAREAPCESADGYRGRRSGQFQRGHPAPRPRFDLRRARMSLRTAGSSPLEMIAVAGRSTDADCAYARTRITTRRFWARPSRVLFGAIGLSSP